MSSSKYRPVGYHPPAGDPHKRTGRPHKAVPKRSKKEMIAIGVGIVLALAVGIASMVVYMIAGSHIPLNMSQMGTDR